MYNQVMNKQNSNTQTELAVQAYNVSKRFEVNERTVTLRHNLQQILRRRQIPVSEEGQFWALRDITFSISKGDSLGIIGHNGAGKTTLLRVLSQISAPTTGQVTVNGSYATLIALGAGFNHQKSGRENIYLNAAIQGASIKLINALIPEIIAFAELEDFIDMPVKRYSTGMAARLGFSIAVHTLPEIIFLDEILSVGDVAFQEKSKQKIVETVRNNRTLVYVSHSLASVRELCNRVIWLDHGRIMRDGPSDEVIEAYKNAMGIKSEMQHV